MSLLLLTNNYKITSSKIILSSISSLRSFNNYPSNVAAIYPKRIIIVRHGESKGNLNDKAYVNTPDWLIPLSKVGEAQSTALGKRIRALLEHDEEKDESASSDDGSEVLQEQHDPNMPPSPLPKGYERVYLYTSPYLRTKQTLARLTQQLHPSRIIGINDSAHLTEQMFGNFQDISDVRRSKQERIKYGRFYYRFPLGESGLDVYSRASSFISTLFRDFRDRTIVPDENCSLILMTHGLTMRLLVMRFFQYSVRDFESSVNAGNCGTIVMERNALFDGGESGLEERKSLYNLTPESLELIGLPPPNRKVTLQDLIEEGSRSKLGYFQHPR